MTTTELKIRVYGDKCLRQKSSCVDEVGATERILIDSMFNTMYANKGIGLAAPQVGIGKRIFVADIGDGPVAVINPRIIKKKGSDIMEEGCLSVPGVGIKIKRPTDIVLRYIDTNNNKVEHHYSGLMARVIQHETDHLNGKLIVDYVSWRERIKNKKQLKELQKLSKKDSS